MKKHPHPFLLLFSKKKKKKSNQYILNEENASYNKAAYMHFDMCLAWPVWVKKNSAINLEIDRVANLIRLRWQHIICTQDLVIDYSFMA